MIYDNAKSYLETNILIIFLREVTLLKSNRIIMKLIVSLKYLIYLYI